MCFVINCLLNNIINKDRLKMEAAQNKCPQETVESVIYFKAIKDNSSCSISSAKKEIIAELRDKRVSLKRRVDFKGSIGATILDKFLCKNKPNC